ncbi:hypothetical protein BH10PSE17_BH10PSE17_16930 [soil metagenome]
MTAAALPRAAASSSTPGALDADRLARLAAELREAWGRTHAAQVREFAADVAGDLGRSVTRRVVKVGRLLASVSRGVHRESTGAIAAARDGRFAAHAAQRRDAAAGTISTWSTRARVNASTLRQAFARNPRESTIQLFVFTLAALAGSGGLDAQGGSPDIDLPFTAHDSHAALVTHSIFMGAALETMCLATVRLIDLVHAGLPDQRDPLWDRVHARSAPYARTASRGLSAGVAYHLLIDGLVDPHDVPAGWSSQAWQAWLLTNAKVEGFDAATRSARPSRSS